MSKTVDELLKRLPWQSVGWEKWSWLLLVGLTLVYALPAVWSAPTGAWQPFIFWPDNDPGGLYIPSAHQVFLEPGKLLCAGHPGLPLQFFLYFQQIALYQLLDPLREFSFTEFSARHIWDIWIMARLSMVVLHIFSFYLLFHFSLAITKNRYGSFITVLAYATSLPAFYFLVNVSVEPFLVISFLLTFIMLWKACDLGIAAGDNQWKVSLFAFLAGLAAVSGAFSKFVILGPLPFVCLFILLILVIKKVDGSKVVLGSYLAATIVATLIYSFWTDWQSLLAVWRPNVSSGESYTPATIFATLRKIGNPLNVLFSHAVVPSCVRNHVFFLAEPGFILLGAMGIFFMLIKKMSGRLAWPLVYAGFTILVWLYRGTFTKDLHGFHYLMIAMVIWAVGLGSLVSKFYLPQTEGSLRFWVVVWVMVFLMHQTAILTVMDAKWRNEFTYKNNNLQLFGQALAALPKDSRIALIGWSGDLHGVHGLSSSTSRIDTPSFLIQTAHGLFVKFDGNNCDEELIEKMLAASIATVLDFRFKQPKLLTMDAFRTNVCKEPVAKLGTTME